LNLWLTPVLPDVQKEVPLGNPDVLVCSVGTEIFFEHEGASPEPDKKWIDVLNQGWDRDAAVKAAAGFPQLKMQVGKIPTLKHNGQKGVNWDILGKLVV
jgi:hypothetical protein